MNQTFYNVNLSHENFIHRLRHEYGYHLDGGTPYRQETSRLSLKVALMYKKVNPFLNMDKSREVVSEYLSYSDEERKNDVAKMLHVTAKSMYIENSVSDGTEKYIMKKMKNKMQLV